MVVADADVEEETDDGRAYILAAAAAVSETHMRRPSRTKDIFFIFDVKFRYIKRD